MELNVDHILFSYTLEVRIVDIQPLCHCVSETVEDRTKLLLVELTGRRISPFVWYQYQRPRFTMKMTLNGHYMCALVTSHTSFGAHLQKKSNEDTLILSTTKV